jgi:hypothetical protein
MQTAAVTADRADADRPGVRRVLIRFGPLKAATMLRSAPRVA